MNKRFLFFMILIVFLFLIGISNAKAITIKDDGAYAVGFFVKNGDIDGFDKKIVKFDFDEDDTLVTLSDLIGDSEVFLQGYTLTGWLDENDPVTSFTKEEIINSSFSFDGGDLLFGKKVVAGFDSNEELPSNEYYLTLYSGIGLLDGKQYTNVLRNNDYFWYDLDEYVPVKEGYTFRGWYFQYLAGDITKMSSFVTSSDFSDDSNCLKLIAAWDSNSFDINKKRYVLDANGGVFSNNNTSVTHNFEYSSINDIFIIDTDNPTKKGYAFDKWKFNPNGTGRYVNYIKNSNFTDTNCGNSCNELDSITLYATWKKSAIIHNDGGFTVLFNAGNGDKNIDGNKYKMVKFDVWVNAININLSDLLSSIPFYKGTSFLGWEYNDSVITNIPISELEVGTFKFNNETYDGIVLNATFGDETTIDLNKYYLNLYSGIGLINDKKYINVVKDTNNFTINLNDYTPVKEGYTFKGWYQLKYNAIDMKNYYEKVTSINANDFNVDRYNNVDLFAGWQSNSADENKPIYTLHGNGGTINGVTDITYNFELENSADPYVFAFDIPVRMGYKFLGWKDRADGNFVTYIDGSDDISTYDFDAQWQKLTYTGVTSKVLAKVYGYDDIKLTWNRVSDATLYKLYYKRSTSKYYTYYGSTRSLYQYFPNLTDGVKYYFKVVAVKVFGNDSIVSSKYRYTTIYTLKRLNTPVVGKYSRNYVKVRWNNIYGESGYEIARSRYKTKSFYIVKRVSYKYSSSIVKTTRGYTYYYKVRAYKYGVDGKRIYGPWTYLKSYKLR